MRHYVSLISALAFLATSLHAATIIKKSGERISRVTLTDVTYEEVRYRIRGISIVQRLPGDEVREIILSSSGGLETARNLVEEGQWDAALEVYDKVRLNPAEKESAAFGAAWCLYRRYDDTGEQPLEAAKGLLEYLQEYRPRRGFHVPRALYLFGDVQRRRGKLEEAAKAFRMLEGISGESRELAALIGQAQLDLARYTRQEIPDHS